MRAADLVNIKLMKSGGILNAMKINAIAEAAGISAQVGTMVESSIASAAGLHAAIAMTNVKTVEMGGPLMLARISATPAPGMSTTGHCAGCPGLGITVDVDRVRQFSDGWWTVEA